MQQTIQITKRGTRNLCKFCGEYVNLNDEGTQFRDGSCAHEECEDGDIFRRENESDFRD